MERRVRRKLVVIIALLALSMIGWAIPFASEVLACQPSEPGCLVRQIFGAAALTMLRIGSLALVALMLRGPRSAR